MSGERAVVRLYGALVHLYPRGFRAEYGGDMVQLARDQCSEEPAWRVCGRALLDLAITLPSQHMEAHMNRPPDHLVPLVYTAVAAGGLLLALAGGTSVAMLVAGLAIAVVAGAMAVVAWRRSGPMRANVASGNWWKFLLAGPCIVLLVIAGAGLGIEEWLLMMASIFTAFVLTSIGVVLGVARLIQRRSPSLHA